MAVASIIPAALVAVSIAGTVGATLIQAQAQAKQYDAQAQAADLNADNSRYNAEVARQNQNMAKAEGTAKREAHLRQVRMVLGKRRAQAGKAGIALTGSFTDVTNDVLMQGALDLANIKYNTRKEVFNYKNQERGFIMEQNQYASEAAYARQAKPLSIGGTLLAGASSAVGTYSQFSGGGVDRAFAN